MIYVCYLVVFYVFYLCVFRIFFVVDSDVLWIVLESYALHLVCESLLLMSCLYQSLEIFVLWLKIFLLFLISLFFKSGLTGCPRQRGGRTTWSYHCAVFVVFQLRCSRQRLDSPCGLSDLSPFHSNLEQFKKKKLLTRIFSLNEDITEEIKKWDHIIQKLSKEYTNIKKERHSLVASVLSGFQH